MKIFQFVLALLLTVSMMLEMYTDHYRSGPHDGDDVNVRSKYFVMTTGALAFVIMNWVVNSVTFSRIGKLNGAFVQVFYTILPGIWAK